MNIDWTKHSSEELENIDRSLARGGFDREDIERAFECINRKLNPPDYGNGLKLLAKELK